MSLSSEDLSELISPAYTAVLVIDKQYGYFQRKDTPTTDLLAKLASIDSFILSARSKDVPVYWTQMVENIDDSPENIRYIMSHSDYIELTREGRQSFEFIGDALPTVNEKVIVKNYYNAFAKTDLADSFRERGIKTVILVGGYASRCVFATAIGALDEDLRVVIPQELVGNTDNTQSEVPTALAIINSIYGFAIGIGEIEAAWEGIGQDI